MVVLACGYVFFYFIIKLFADFFQLRAEDFPSLSRERLGTDQSPSQAKGRRSLADLDRCLALSLDFGLLACLALHRKPAVCPQTNAGRKNSDAASNTIAKHAATD